MSVPTTIACLQTAPVLGETQANLDAAEPLVLGADADLIVLPELFASGYFFESTAQARALAEAVPDGPTTERLVAWARATGAVIVGGLPERDGDRLYNSAVIATNNGHLGTYRKTHLYYEETLHFTPGDGGFEVWTVTDRNRRSYRLGVMICFDWFFPESARTLALHGADVIAHPSNLVLAHCPAAMPIRALENGVYTATANRVGSESNGRETLTFVGQSRICSPKAEVLATAERTGAATVRAQIDPRMARNTALNAYNDRRTDRRPDLYAR